MFISQAQERILERLGAAAVIPSLVGEKLPAQPAVACRIGTPRGGDIVKTMLRFSRPA